MRPHEFCISLVTSLVIGMLKLLWKYYYFFPYCINLRLYLI